MNACRSYNIVSEYSILYTFYMYDFLLCVCRLQCENFQSDSPASNHQLPAFELIQKWKVDTGKCVDASPLLVQDKSHDPSKIIYIGSHSGKFFAICFQTGRVLWDTQLTDRIESSACLSMCGQFVVVGKSIYNALCIQYIHVLNIWVQAFQYKVQHLLVHIVVYN